MKSLIAAACLAATALGGAAAHAFDYEKERKAILDRQAKIEANRDGLSEAERLDALIELSFDYTMLEYPEFATYLGHGEYHDRWTDNSEKAIAKRDKDTRDVLKVLEDIDRSQLEGDDRLNYDLLADSLRQQVDGQRFDGDYLQISQLGGIHQNAPQLFAMMPATSPKQYNDILSRLEGLPTQVDATLALLKKGLAKGVTPPQVTLRDVPQQVANILTDEPLKSPVLLPFTRIPDSIDKAEADALRERAAAIYTDSIRPAYEKLHAFLVDEYLPGARESIAMSALPQGKDWYAYNVAQMTTTDLSPQAIHDIGLSEVKRIRAEMDKVIEETGFEGDFAAFTDFLRTDPQFYYTSAEDLLRGYRDISKRADAASVRVIGKLPRLPYGVVPVPEYAEKSQTTAYYMPGSAEAGRPGEFFANTYDLASRPQWEMEALTLHEAVPGHHLQIALQQELEDMAWFRRHGGYTAYIEGWGLYAESLGEEMGFYQDPYSKFGQLTYEMWRAVRLVVDTGMHALGWSREQAIDFFRENTGKADHDIVVEVDRYIVWPGQALAYKIGELKIKELRARAEDRLGDRFDVRAFHDVVLGSGALPLGVLETLVDEWIDGQLAS